MKTLVSPLAWAAAVLTLGSAPATAQFSVSTQVHGEGPATSYWRPIAMSGDTTVGPNGQANLSLFGYQMQPGTSGAPSVDGYGFGGFAGFADDALGTFEGIWKSYGYHQLLATTGWAAPGTGGTFDRFPNPFFNEPPHLVNFAACFDATVTTGTGPSLYGVFSDRFGGLQLVALEGDPAPGLPPELNPTLRMPSGRLATDSSILISAAYSDADDGPFLPKEQEGFWRDAGNGLQLLIADDMPAPGTPAGVVFGESGSLGLSGPFDHWMTSRAGKLVFHGNLKGPGVTLTTDEGIWVEGANELELVAREGDPAPGAGADAVFGTSLGPHGFGYSTVEVVRNEKGATFFGAQVSGTGFDFCGTLWLYENGQLTMVAKALQVAEGCNGTTAPGTGGEVFLGFFQHGAINGRGTVAFQSFLEDKDQDPWTFDSGIFRGRPGNLKLVAETTGPVPGVAGATFTGVQLCELLDNGMVTFTGSYEGPGIGPEGDQGFFAQHSGGKLASVVVEGQVIDVTGDGTDLRTVLSFGTGRATPEGFFSIKLAFTDGSSGVFTVRIIDTTHHMGTKR
jgi:hypothetical protein